MAWIAGLFGNVEVVLHVLLNCLVPKVLPNPLACGYMSMKYDPL